MIEELRACIIFENNFTRPDKYVLTELEKEIKKLEKLIL